MIIGITGGCGYVASILGPLLARRVDQVDLIDIRPPVNEVAKLFSTKRCAYLKADVSQAETMKEIAARYDVIIHLAALVGYPACKENPELARQSNVVTTENVMRFKKKNARVIYASTISAFGDQPDDVLVTETTPVHPNSIYGQTKREAELVVLANKPNGTVLRFAGSFGFAPQMRHDLLIHDFACKAAAGERLSIYENTFVRQFIHVRDMAEALIFTLDHGNQMGGEVFNVGNPRVEITKRDLVQQIAKQCPFPYEFEESGKDLEKRNYRVSFKKMLSVGFTPRMTLDAGLRELIPYYKQSLPKELANVG